MEKSIAKCLIRHRRDCTSTPNTWCQSFYFRISMKSNFHFTNFMVVLLCNIIINCDKRKCWSWRKSHLLWETEVRLVSCDWKQKVSASYKVYTFLEEGVSLVPPVLPGPDINHQDRRDLQTAPTSLYPFKGLNNYQASRAILSITNYKLNTFLLSQSLTFIINITCLKDDIDARRGL